MDQSGRGAPLIGSARRLSGNGRKSLLLLTPGTVSPAASILTPLSSLPSAQHHTWTLHRCCRTLIYLHYAAVHMIHFSFYTANNLHSNHTGVAYEAAGLGEVCVYKQEFSLCVCAPACLTFTSSVSTLRLTWVIPQRTALVDLYVCQERSPLLVLYWCDCERPCVCVSYTQKNSMARKKKKKKLFVCPSTEMRVRHSEKREEGRG